MKRGRAACVLLSEEQYQRLRGAAWEHLGETIAAMREGAEAKGLTQEKLDELLTDDS